MADTGISYLTKALNYVVGCDPISDGCLNCWARRVATTRLRRLYGSDFRPRVISKRLRELMSWRGSHRIGVSMMGDLFHDEVSFEAIDELWACMWLRPQHTFLVFTKRPRRFVEYMRHREAGLIDEWGSTEKPVPLVLPNVIAMVSACNQRDVDEFVPWLLRIPAAKRGLSLEPLLGPVDLEPALWLTGASTAGPWRDCLGRHRGGGGIGGQMISGVPSGDIGWVIVGCESGPGRRPMGWDWVRVLRDQCVQAGVKFYFKQATGVEDPGSWPVVPHPVLDGRQWMEFPEVVR